jgi:hypothetical protein
MIPRNSATRDSTTIWRRKHTQQGFEEKRSIHTDDGMDPSGLPNAFKRERSGR